MKRTDPTPLTAGEGLAETAATSGAVDSHASATIASQKPALPRDAELLQRVFWSVPETAFLMRVGVRTVWRLMADPKSKFPKAHRVRGRTLLARDEVLAYMAQEATR